jgi:hypothetical protein
MGTRLFSLLRYRGILICHIYIHMYMMDTIKPHETNQYLISSRLIIKWILIVQTIKTYVSDCAATETHSQSTCVNNTISTLKYLGRPPFN